MTAKPDSRTYRVLEQTARYLAYFGGVILAALAVMTVISVTGRALVSFGLAPVKGDFEMVEMGTAIAVFSFLPWCQLNRGHVTVDIVVDAMKPIFRAVLTFIGDVLMVCISGVMLWRLWLGFGEKFPYLDQGLRDALNFGYKPFSAETTWILGLPVWWGYILSMPGAVFFFLVCIYSVRMSLRGIAAEMGGQA